MELIAPNCFHETGPSLIYAFCTDKSGRQDELSFFTLMHNEDGSPSPLMWMLLLLIHDKKKFLPFYHEHLFPQEKAAIRQLQFHFDDKGYSQKQELWILSQLYADKPITKVPSDAELQFEKRKKGPRKNTVFLKTV